jgi:hypothetical protein
MAPSDRSLRDQPGYVDAHTDSMASRVLLRDFYGALDHASRNRVAPLREYLQRLGSSLRVAAQRGECARYSRHVELLLIAATLVSICGWMPRYRKWSRRIEQMLSGQMPSDLRRALRRIDLKCRDCPPKLPILIRAPARWRAGSWMLEPVLEDRKKRRV